ncbi:MAG: 3-deoxy-7-phosphoheptulonate synthase [Lachnospiraceae bacterium]|nr:3-deoxy-7-phosphoheptulonate synthase [Lachnospiraceae bacterium]
MGFEYISQMPTPSETKQQFPLEALERRAKKKRDGEIKRVLTGEDDRFLVVIGPCSADREDAVLDYVERLARIGEKVAEKLLLIPRIYTSKPRTTGSGYKGLFHQPNPEAVSDLYAGMLAVRRLHMKVVQETGLTTADELLYPENYEYLSDLISYMAVGARSVEDQQHRLVVSGFDIACGLKNPTGGDLSVMMNSVTAAQSSHHFAFRGWEVVSDGNPYAHAILRGYVDASGRNVPNYHYEDLQMLYELYAKTELKHPACVVDTNHANSGKKFAEQIRITKEVLHSRRHSRNVADLVKGVMIESYLEDGSQKVGDGVYGRSITDPCLGWAKTERLLYEMADMV